MTIWEPSVLAVFVSPAVLEVSEKLGFPRLQSQPLPRVLHIPDTERIPPCIGHFLAVRHHLSPGLLVHIQETAGDEGEIAGADRDRVCER
jgi:hypothetical protein